MNERKITRYRMEAVFRGFSVGAGVLTGRAIAGLVSNDFVVGAVTTVLSYTMLEVLFARRKVEWLSRK